MSLATSTPVRGFGSWMVASVRFPMRGFSEQLWTMPSEGSGLQLEVADVVGAVAEMSGPADQSGNCDPFRTTGSTLRSCGRDGAPGLGTGFGAAWTSGDTPMSRANTARKVAPLRTMTMRLTAIAGKSSEKYEKA